MDTRPMAAIGVLLLCSCGTASQAEDEPDSVGGPARAVSVEEARDVEVGTRIRVTGALLVSGTSALMCDALAESSPPQCLGGMALAGFDRSVLPPDTPSARGTRRVEEVQVIAERTRDGLRYVG